MSKQDKPKKTIQPAADNKAARKKQLELVLGSIDKQYGKGSIRRGLKGNSVPDVEFFSTQSIGIDRALGGGWPRGRVVEVYGPESSGKTTLCLHATAEIQRDGGVAAFIDAEHALDPKYAEALGINMEDLLLSQPDSGEQALEITEMLVRSGAVDLIVIDSVAALVPQKEIEGEMGDAQMGSQARLMSQALRKLTAVIAKTKCTVMFINQIRMKIGVMFGNPETTTGGNALKFYASQRVDIRRIGGIKDGKGGYIGNRTRVKVIKNKVAPPFREHEFSIIYGKGIDIYEDLLTVAVEEGIVDKNGSWYSYQNDRLGQGGTQASMYLQNHLELYKDIKERIVNGQGTG